ncbi:MAG: AMP-binding protein [Ruminococcus sp.]|nr:AMP-binding protein [Candidatus Copronaster equi]
MKTKVNYKKYGTFPNMDTVKDIVIYGANLGKNKKQFMFKNFNNKVETKTFNQVFYDATGLGQYLYSLGMREKKIAILSENSYYWIAAFYSIATGRNIAVPIDAKLPNEDIVDIVVRSSSSAIYYTKDFSQTIELMKNTEGVSVEHYIPLEDFDMLVEKGHNELKNGAENYLDDTVSGDDLGFIVYTSGTTGKSKGVMLSQKNVASNGIATCRAMTASQTVAFLPFHHTLSWASALTASPLLAEWGYICPSLRSLQNDMAEYHPQHITAVPLAVETIYKRIWFTAQKQGMDKKLEKGIKISNFLRKFGIDVRRKLFKEVIDNLGGKMEMIICGGAFLDEKYEKGLYEMGIQVINGYGITECSPTVTCNRLNDFKFGSAGKPLECNEIKIANPDEDGVGEICVRGSNVMLGYYNEPEATAEVFDGEWLKTGDFGYIDNDGFLFFRGRKKNLIVLSNGKNVSPEEIEDKLSCIDYVSEVVVYEENGFITAELYLNKDVNPEAEIAIKNDIHSLNRHMPSYKQVSKIKLRDTEFPKTTTLKIKRNAINKK